MMTALAGWIVAPYSLEPKHVALFGKTAFVDVITLRMKRLSWIVWAGSKCNHKCPPKREAGQDLTYRAKKVICVGTQI